MIQRRDNYAIQAEQARVRFLTYDQSAMPVEKDADAVLDIEAGIGDRVNCAYMGTVITYGRGKGVITDIGMQTQMGNIADMLNETPDESTPLQKKLDNLGNYVNNADQIANLPENRIDGGEDSPPSDMSSDIVFVVIGGIILLTLFAQGTVRHIDIAGGNNVSIVGNAL